MPRNGVAPGANRMTNHILAIYQGTSSRAIVFCADRTIAAVVQEEFPSTIRPPARHANFQRG
jgi:hypothetical protein